MRIIEKPEVSLIGLTQFFPEQAEDHIKSVLGVDSLPALNYNELDRFHYPEQALIETAGRMCYQSFTKGRPHREHVRHLVKVGHLSVIEHVNFTFLITGISRSLLAEFTRHRHLSPSVLSQRYVNHNDHNIGFVVPHRILELGPESVEWANWQKYCSESMVEYVRSCEHYLSLGWDRKEVYQTARAILPECTETRLVVTGNARTWREIFPKRMSTAAEPEIRRLVKELNEWLVVEMPDVFEDQPCD